MSSGTASGFTFTHTSDVNLQAGCFHCYNFCLYLLFACFCFHFSISFPNSLPLSLLFSHLQDFSIQEWITKGAPKEKLVVGLPTYGKFFIIFLFFFIIFLFLFFK